jgi:hypothetical protein
LCLGSAQETIARVSGSGVSAAMVELIINCANVRISWVDPHFTLW